MRPATRLFALLAVLFALAPASAADSLEVFKLSYRTAEEIAPLLTPHLPSGASLSGQGDTLIVKADPAVVRDVRRLLRELDVAPRAVLIAVRVGSSGSVHEQAVGGRGSAGSRGASGSVRIYRSNGLHDGQRQQQVRALEGRAAFIGTSLLVPVQDRVVVVGRDTGVAERTRFIELTQGFYAVARLNGDWVEVDIGSADDQPGPGQGARLRRVETTASGRLGEWLLIGSSGESSSHRGDAISYRSRDAAREQHQVWLKVDLAGDR